MNIWVGKLVYKKKKNYKKKLEVFPKEISEKAVNGMSKYIPEFSYEYEKKLGRSFKSSIKPLKEL